MSHADTTDILAAKGDLYDKNLFAYCDNNPVARVDYGGEFWETLFDVISLGTSIVEVCIKPSDPWAGAGVVGDTIDLLSLPRYNRKLGGDFILRLDLY